MSSSNTQENSQFKFPDTRIQWSASNERGSTEEPPKFESQIEDTEIPKPVSGRRYAKSSKKAAWVEPPVVKSHMDHTNTPTVEQRKWATRVNSEGGKVSGAMVKNMFMIFPETIKDTEEEIE
ncbi:hypothetical protein EYC84_009756 [Monilinia fructicola]|uniref:Uncharacterized protein n=1 Tax=Monilinia fructicola TaxID=38448 RepID=A0A5M9JAZ7_MONFR|nr:hypothetical protein EYC84_009756 [Monilinia fructicola]